MTYPRLVLALCLAAACCAEALAETERPGKLVRVEYVYETDPEVGPVRVAFAWHSPRPLQIGVQVNCKLFESDVPPEAIPAVALSVHGHALSWSTPIDPETGETGDPELWLSVPLVGRAGGDPGHHTYVVFHFDHEGNITRSLKREYYRPTHWNGVTIRADWPVDAESTPEELLDTAYAEHEKNQQATSVQAPDASN
ncbi:MAG: hypothetical protein AAF288_09650 [Planctomycetota bacterium]